MHKATHVNVLLSMELTSLDPLDLKACVKKYPEHPRQSYSVLGWFDISVKQVFIEQHRASLSHPFNTLSPFQPRHYWQACSLTGKAITSAHWQRIACCANRFGVRLKEPNSVHYVSDNLHSFDALLHTSRTICLKMSVFFMLFFTLSNADISFCHSRVSFISTPVIIFLYIPMQSWETLMRWNINVSLLV